MLSVLIIDDEVITRKGLKSHISWQRLGIDHIYDAGNAKEALLLAEEKKPDIILSDVCMPGMNGIEMCTKVKEMGLKSQIVFLSGYSDKEYLKGAIALAAVSYVEKPVNIAEVEEALEQAAAKCMQNQKEEAKIKKLLTENYSMVQKRLIDRLLMPEINAKLLEQDFYKLKIDWSNCKQFAVVLFRMTVTDGTDERVRQNIIQQMKVIPHISGMRGHLYAYVCAFEEGQSEQLETVIADISSELSKREFYCAVGSHVSRIAEIFHSYQTAEAAMKRLNFWKTMHIARADEKPETEILFDDQLLLDFEQSLKQYREENAMSCCRELYSHMEKQQNVTVSSMQGIYFRFLDIIFQMAGSLINQKKYADTETISVIWEKLNSLENLSQYQQYLEEETQEYFSNHEELAASNQLILSIIAYIQSNYQEPELNLNQIADHVFLSPNYLSTMFKKKMGKTIGQYITDVRVENARKLLSDRRLKLYDVAIQTGYKDANYFTKIFKKTVGMTPSEYRENC